MTSGSVEYEHYMRYLLDTLAGTPGPATEIPVAACVVTADGDIIGYGGNECEYRNSPAAHAEIIAVNAAAARLGGWRLRGCTLYVTLEPCLMCMGAAVNAQMKRIVFGAYADKPLFDIQELPLLVKGGVLESECTAVLREYFAALREVRNPQPNS